MVTRAKKLDFAESCKRRSAFFRMSATQHATAESETLPLSAFFSDQNEKRQAVAPQLTVVHCECNLDSLLPEYLGESAALGVHLEHFDCDIGAFHLSHLREELTGRLIPPTALQPEPPQVGRSLKGKKKTGKKKPELPPGSGDAWRYGLKHALKGMPLLIPIMNS